MALVVDGFHEHAGLAVREEAGMVVGEVSGTDDVDAVRRQAARIFSLDHDGSGFPEVAGRDQVVKRLVAQAPGFRPVLFHTPYEAAAWAILSQRVNMRQASAMRTRIGEAIGRTLTVAGQDIAAFPLPGALLEAQTLPGVPDVKTARLHAVADAALAGRLEAERLRALPADEARAELRAISGIGPFSADLILLRGCGPTDVFAPTEGRLRRAMAREYEVDERDDAALEAVAEGWRPFRTWVSVLFRAVAESG